MSALRSDDEPSPQLRSHDDLEALFDSGCKERTDWKIGVEYEKPVVLRDTGEAAPYHGSTGIGAVLEELRQRWQWSPVYEDNQLIALTNDRASITLEPGGQLEMSGELCDSLHCAHAELSRHVAEIVSVGNDLGVAFLGLGITPKSPLESMPWMPKQRYRLMRIIMEATGSLGHRMMQQTATVQANFDYASESDARRKFRVAMAISPVLIAVSANSPIADGHDTGFKSYRAHAWTRTDPARCGVLAFAFDCENLFGAYSEYALDVPMYFIQRGDNLIPAEGMTFRSFMSKGFAGEVATLNDWNTHLATLFPEARLKTYIEVRSADAQEPRLMLATPALMKGLLYTDDCLDAAWDVLARWSLEERYQAIDDAAKSGLSARVHGHSLRDYARELVEIASEGLRRQALADTSGRDERLYLAQLAGEVEAGRCPADHILSMWNGHWAGDVDRLIDHSSYRQDSLES